MMRLSCLIFIVIFLTSLSSLYSQSVDATALQQQLRSVEGSKRVDILNTLTEQLKFEQPAQAKAYAEEAYSLSNKLAYLKGISTSAVQLGIFERDANNYIKAIRIVNTGLEAARTANDYPAALAGLEVLKTIYQRTNRPRKMAEVEAMYKQIKTRIDLRQTSEQLAELEKVIEVKEDELNLSEQEKLQIAAEKAAVADELAMTIEDKLRKEAELARVGQERAELEKEALQLEKEAVENALLLQKERNIRNLAFAIMGIFLFLILAGWQRSRFKRQQKLAEIERQRVARLEEIDRLKDQFLANTSHELRTPLNGIIGIAEWLQEKRKEVSPEVLKDNLSMLISAGKRLHKLVNDIMDFSRLQHAELQLILKPLDVRSLTEMVLRINQPLAKAKQLSLINNIPADLPSVLADEDRLQQILHNLIGNAIKFTNEGSITVSAQDAVEVIKISVTDTGIGIAPEKHETIFEAFQQEDGSSVREFAGTGLGLSITKYLVDLHKGEISLTSKPGEGTTFHFSLPKTDEAPVAITLEHEPSTHELLPLLGDSEPAVDEVAAASTEQKVNILIVDDEPLNQHVFNNHLDASHYQITTALNGADALKAIDGPVRFDLVVLDVMMPRMSGYEVCEQIRKKYLPSELPIIMVTAKNLVKDLVEGLNTGANDYLAKPFSRQEFLARIKNLLNLHTLNQASSRFVPNAFLQTLGKDNITQVRLGDLVERDVTVFFGDIRDYTSLSEKMTPEENFKFVKAFNSRMGPVIDQNHGFINQYLGDAIMAIFKQSPRDALQAAIDYQKTLQHYNKERLKRQRRPISSGIGLHTGKLVMGIIGDDKRMDAATISDTVNTAARMESLNKHYATNILFSEDSLTGIGTKEDFNFRYLGKVQLKGKNRPVGVYECFDGDAPQLLELKIKTLSSFNEGLQHFFAQDFQQAQKILEEVINISPEDLTAQLFLKECRQYLTSGVPEGWTGLNKMEVK
ncbi:ATP-binding protein [Lewinella sp. LCG006]|uniref:ATP-binding protein n=1 Tax=Lewinella sp. LCG006 TaxID=3231911 RepID=UPI003460CAD7